MLDLLFFSFSVLIWFVIGGILIYVIVHRVKAEATEDFEKRDN